MAARVTWDKPDLHSFADIGISLHQMQQAVAFQREKILGEITFLLPLAGMEGMLPFFFLDDVLCLWESGHKPLIWTFTGVASTMVKVEMGIDDKVYVFRIISLLFKDRNEAWLVVHRIKLVKFLLKIGAYSCIHKNEFFARVDEDGVQSKLDPVFAVRRTFPAPENFGDNTKHGPSIKIEESVSESEYFELSEGNSVECHPMSLFRS